MRKIWVITCREYRVAVRSKAFVISMLMMPVLLGASVGLQLLFKKLEDLKEKHYAVVDRSGGSLANALVKAAEQYNETEAIDPQTKTPVKSRIIIEVIPPADDISRQRYDLSQRVEKDEIEGIVEIGAKVFEAKPNQNPDKVEVDEMVRFQAKKPTQQVFMAWARKEIAQSMLFSRFSQMKIKPDELAQLLQLPPLEYRALTQKQADGRFVDSSEGVQIVNFMLPVVLIGLMFMVVMVGAMPAMQGIVEEKSQRIAEVMLGSASPFEIMAGKLVGVIGVSLTMASVYLVGGYFVADRYGYADMLTPTLLAWFLIFLVMSLLSFGSLFIAVGAAAGDIKDTQTLLMPIMVIATMPFFALGPIMQDPNGKIAVIFSFFPFATPMLLVARQSVPPGVPLVQMIAGIILVLATTFICVWSAGRIFRVGILMQGKGARFGDLAKWVFRG